jgi:RHH-type rel operon transcriptional repressor/antitoxin RelB
MLAVRLPPEAESRLAALAKATGRSKAACARQAILDYLDDLEDLHLAEQRYADLQAGRSQTLSGEEFWRDLAD